jgi:hypothetical protein
VRTTLRIPGVSAGASAFTLHLLSVFASAFVFQMVLAGVANAHSWPALLALICSAAATGLAAAIHVVLGLIPDLNLDLAKWLGSSSIAQIVTSALTVFGTTFATQIALGASNAASIGTLYALLVAAVTSAGAAVFHYGLGIVPVPVAPPAPAPTGSPLITGDTKQAIAALDQLGVKADPTTPPASA